MSHFRFKRIVWSPVEEDFLKKNSKKIPINQLTIQLAKSRAAIKRKLDEFDGKAPLIKKNKKSYIGKRKDLKDQYFRSAWEANIARYLNYKNIKWEYEPRVFVFSKFRTGTLTYCPDFYLPESDIWLEVKGQIIAQAKTATRRFKKFFPNECAKLVALTGSPKTKATEFYNGLEIPIYAFYNDLNKEYKEVISNWE